MGKDYDEKMGNTVLNVQSQDAALFVLSNFERLKREDSIRPSIYINRRTIFGDLAKLRDELRRCMQFDVPGGHAVLLQLNRSVLDSETRSPVLRRYKDINLEVVVYCDKQTATFSVCSEFSGSRCGSEVLPYATKGGEDHGYETVSFWYDFWEEDKKTLVDPVTINLSSAKNLADLEATLSKLTGAWRVEASNLNPQRPQQSSLRTAKNHCARD